MQSAIRIISMLSYISFFGTSSPHRKASAETGYLHKCLLASKLRFIKGRNSGRSVMVTFALQYIVQLKDGDEKKHRTEKIPLFYMTLSYYSMVFTHPGTNHSLYCLTLYKSQPSYYIAIKAGFYTKSVEVIIRLHVFVYIINLKSTMEF